MIMTCKTQHDSGEKRLDRLTTGREAARGLSERAEIPNKLDRLSRAHEKTILLCRHSQKGSRQILVADAEKNIREFLAGIFSKMGYEPVGAAGWIEALKLFASSKFDLVFTDSKMICWDGFSLAYHIKARSPETPVVIMVAGCRENLSDNHEGCCLDDLLFKPVGPTDIQSVVRKFFGDHSRAETLAFYSDSRML